MESNRWSTITSAGTSIVALATAVVTLFNYIKNSKLELKNSELESSIKFLERESKRFAHMKDSTEFIRDREFKFKVYDVVQNVLDSDNDKRKIAVANVLVSNLVSEKDLDYKIGLLKILESQAIDEDQKLILNQQVDLLQEKSSDIGHRVDIFILETKQSKYINIANDLKETLKGKAKVKIKILSAAKNNSKGYQLFANQIRYESEEYEEAQKLLSTVKTSFSGKIELKLLDQYDSPGYLSIFFCE